MPIYEYICVSCNKVTEEINNSNQQHIKCPYCGGMARNKPTSANFRKDTFNTTIAQQNKDYYGREINTRSELEKYAKERGQEVISRDEYRKLKDILYTKQEPSLTQKDKNAIIEGMKAYIENENYRREVEKDIKERKNSANEMKNKILNIGE